MKNGVRVSIILGCFIGTIALSVLIGNTREAQLQDNSGLTSTAITLIGVFGAIISLLIGVIVSFLLRNKASDFRSLLGYIVPSVATVLLCLLS